MTFVEPPIQPDDTKPNLTLSDTQTISKQRHGIPLWMIVILLLVSGISLFGTINYALSRSTPAETILEPRTIVLRVNGEQEEIQSEASTVDDFLIAENVAVGDNDLVYPNRTTPLADDMIITVAHARSVTVTTNGEAEMLQTPFENPSEILTQAQVEISDSDLIFVDGSQASLSDLSNWTVPANEIIIQRTLDVTIIDGDSETILTTTAETVGDALFEAEIDVFLTDTVSPELSVTLTDDMTITIERASPITIHVDGETIETRVQGTTVLDALAEAGIALVGLDYTIPATDQAITQDTVITVLRVTESIESTDSTIAFETVYQANSTLELDQQRIATAGQLGTERLNERVRFENGIEVSREPIGTEIVSAAQNQVIEYGTNVVIRTVNTPDGVREYWRVIRAYATSYHPEALGGDNITALGMELRKGIIASNPNIIPYRTNLYVPNYGIGIMADTGGTRSSPYWVDLGYSDDDWRSWSQYVDVYLLTPVPAEIDYLLPNFRPMNGIPDN